MGDSFVYTLRQFEKDPDWEWTVERDGEGNFQCSCRLFESDGIPCQHILCVMKTIDTIELPDSLISRRWSMPEMDDYSQSDRLQVGMDSDLHVPRCASLLTIANSICFDASLGDSPLQTVFALMRRSAGTVTDRYTKHLLSWLSKWRSTGLKAMLAMFDHPVVQTHKALL